MGVLAVLISHRSWTTAYRRRRTARISKSLGCPQSHHQKSWVARRRWRHKVTP